ncbi:MAG TPA: V-type ATPase subunit subunit G family protein [Coriobacteriia bacterium]|nr:V-type ATPase subunit subunit G family protein [Coriobacteriia bacterium]
MDENVVEELQFHKQTVQSDDNSPLHLIREKEMEISGRVLAAKRQADEIVSAARKEAGGMIAAAHDQASTEAGKRDASVKAEMEQQMADVRAQAERDAAALEETIKARRGDAVAFVIESVARI